jgi:hypothetical protein
MAFLHHWRGAAWGSLDTAIPGRQDSFVLPDTGPLTVLRTRAFAQAVHADSTALPAFYVGNDIPPLIFRVVMNDEFTDPSLDWPQSLDTGLITDDDVIFEPMHWHDPVYVPANVPFGRDEFVHTYATVAGGIADSKAQRSFGFGQTPKVWWSVNYPFVEEGGSPVTPDFTVNVWIRVLLTGRST